MSVLRYFKKSSVLPFPIDTGISVLGMKQANEFLQKVIHHLISKKRNAYMPVHCIVRWDWADNVRYSMRPRMGTLQPWKSFVKTFRTLERPQFKAHLGYKIFTCIINGRESAKTSEEKQWLSRNESKSQPQGWYMYMGTMKKTEPILDWSIIGALIGGERDMTCGDTECNN